MTLLAFVVLARWCGLKRLPHPRRLWANHSFPTLTAPELLTAGHRGAYAGILIVAALICSVRLTLPLQEPEETRYAEIARQMLVHDRWIVPVLHGRDYFDKPPLLFWLIAAGDKLFGVGPFAAHLPPALASWLTVGVAAWWGRHALGPTGGVRAASLLAFAPIFAYRSGVVGMDGLLGLCVLLTLAAGHLAMTTDCHRRRLSFVVGLALGVGLLAKGPLVLALSLPPLVLFALLDRRARWPRPLDIAIAFAAMLLIAGPWYAAMMYARPQYLSEFVVKHHLQRYADPFDHAGPPWLYLPLLFGGALPGTLLLWPTIRSPKRPAALGLFALATLWILLVFSLSGCKRPAYIMPGFGPLALVLASAWPRWGRWVIGGQFAVVGVVMGLLPATNARYTLDAITRADVAPANRAVVCYPKRWDAVSSGLQREDVQAVGQMDELMEIMRREQGVTLYIKSDRMNQLPTELDWQPDRSAMGVWVGQLRYHASRNEDVRPTIQPELFIK